jgi:hypothetical protein
MMPTRLCSAVGAVTALLCFAVAPASATVVITADNGGRMGDYASRFLQVRQTGERVVIDGVCLSACTMVLGLVPRERVCATSRAVLGFHAAWQPDGQGGRIISAPATQVLLAGYPPAVRAWIARHGGLTPRMMFMRGSELAAIVPTCDEGVRQASRRSRTLTEARANRVGHAGVRAYLRRSQIVARQ